MEGGNKKVKIENNSKEEKLLLNVRQNAEKMNPFLLQGDVLLIPFVDKLIYIAKITYEKGFLKVDLCSGLQTGNEEGQYLIASYELPGEEVEKIMTPEFDGKHKQFILDTDINEFSSICIMNNRHSAGIRGMPLQPTYILMNMWVDRIRQYSVHIEKIYLQKLMNK